MERKAAQPVVAPPVPPVVEICHGAASETGVTVQSVLKGKGIMEKKVVYPRYRNRRALMKERADKCGVEYSAFYRALIWMKGKRTPSARAPSPRLEAAIREHCADLLPKLEEKKEGGTHE